MLLRRLLLTLLVVAAALAGVAQASAATYYVSAGGNDGAAGTSPAAAWQTVSRVNAAPLAPGDTVLFAGGASFSGLLQPPASGSAGAPIVFGSYGSGQANLKGGISLASRSWLVLRGLRVDTGDWRSAGSTRGVTSSSAGSGVQNLTIEDCVFTNVAIGLLIQNRLDRDWVVRGSTISLTRDSGILIHDPDEADKVGGSDMLFEGNQLLDNGIDTSIAYKKHAVYDIGTRITWRKNVVRRFSEGAFSVRARDNVLEGNTITDGPYAIYFSPYDGTAGTTRIVYNTIANVTGAGIEIGNTGNTSNVESFVVANNTISATGSASGLRVVGTAGSVKAANNVVRVASGAAFRVDKVPAKGLTERNNLWYSTSATTMLNWLGSVHTSLATYRAASGQGANDLIANPLLDDSLVPALASPAVDAGSTAVDPTLIYSPACGGRTFEYCGSTVDLGSTELGSGSPPPPPPPVVTPLAPPSALAASTDRSDSIALSWTASPDARTVSYQVLRDGVLVGSTASTVHTLTGLACGTSSTLAVRAVDSGGSTSGAVTATGSTSACAPPPPPPPPPVPAGPTLTITSPTNGQTVSRTFTISADAASSVGIKVVTFWFDGDRPCTDTVAPYVSCSIRTKNGGHTIRVRATDTAGAYVESVIKIWVQS